ncbi:MAG: hypothetical protein AB1689_23370, partial [Thermodesulfobacteriota bacterium]
MQPPRAATLAVTLGDPVGVGPEVALRAVRGLLGAARRRQAAPRIVLLGDLQATRDTAERLGIGVELVPVTREDLGRGVPPAAGGA